MKFSSPLHLHKCMSGAYAAILAVVPPCAGECRFVRVIPVLIFPRGTSCVGFVLPRLMSARPGTVIAGPGLLQQARRSQAGRRSARHRT